MKEEVGKEVKTAQQKVMASLKKILEEIQGIEETINTLEWHICRSDANLVLAIMRIPGAELRMDSANHQIMINLYIAVCLPGKTNRKSRVTRKKFAISYKIRRGRESF